MLAHLPTWLVLGPAIWLLGIPAGVFAFCLLVIRHDRRHDDDPRPIVPLIELGPKQQAQRAREHTGQRLHGRQRLMFPEDHAHHWRSR